MKILCLGNNTEDTDNKTSELAVLNNSRNFGLLSNLENNFDWDQLIYDGYYHTSVYDFNRIEIERLQQMFDKTIILNQSYKDWDHPNAFYNTVITPNAEFINPEMQETNIYWKNIIETNKSFCIFPFIELISYDNYTTVCCRSTKQITHINNLQNYNTDLNYVCIRNSMINAQLIPEHCQYCYSLENKNIISPRIKETIEWCNRLNIRSIDELKKIKTPVYYEIRPNNKCNLKCRMCTPASSHLIEHEYSKIGIISTYNTYDSYLSFDIVDINNLHKLYVAGGEPLIIPEVTNFLLKCIKLEQTDFEININTNATIITEEFKKIISNFTNLQFTISIDAYKDINYYIRYPSKWENIIDNVDYMIAHNHIVSFNTTISIYNITRLYELFDFFNTKYFGHHLHVQLAGSPDGILSPYNNPNISMVLSNLTKSLKLQCCQTPLVSSVLNELKNYYENNQPIDINRFYTFNDKLDSYRNITLNDYIPELNSFR